MFTGTLQAFKIKQVNVSSVKNHRRVHKLQNVFHGTLPRSARNLGISGHFYARLPVALRVATIERRLQSGVGGDNSLRKGPGDPPGASGQWARQSLQLAAFRIRVWVRGRGGRAAVLCGGGVVMRPGLGQYARSPLGIKTQPDWPGVSVLPVPHRDGELLLLLFPQVRCKNSVDIWKYQS